MSPALLLIDLQNDFMPFGGLAVAEADAVIPVANTLIPQFKKVVATQDWHPADHGSFAANHPWRKPGQVIELNGLPQVLWPMHCVQGSFGAEFAPTLDTANFTKVFPKGTDAGIDSYSGFYDNGHRKSTGLAEWLHKAEIDTLYVMGVATDFCVKFSVLDALAEGFAVSLITDGCRGVNLEAGDSERALAEMKGAGAKLIVSEEVAGILTEERS